MLKETKAMATQPKRSQWDIEDAHRTLQRAEALKADKGMMKDVVKHHNMMTKALGGAIKSMPAKVTPSKPAKKK
jgi:hypothetical protein